MPETPDQASPNPDSADSSVSSVSLGKRALAAPAGSGDGETYAISVEHPLLEIDGLNLHYGDVQALFGISLEIPRRTVTAFIGPSGCGKSTFLRCLNRLNDLFEGVRVSGSIKLDGMEIHDPEVEVTKLRRRVGMVFQSSTPLPRSIYENVVYGLRIGGLKKRARLDEAAERSLRDAALWDEVKDRLHTSALELSGGQMQRLCIARAIAVNPEVLLMDEPCSALDPIATSRIEELIHELKSRYTVVIVTHNMQQAARVSEYTAFLYLGRLVEFNHTTRIFTHPQIGQTQDYITGRFG